MPNKSDYYRHMSPVTMTPKVHNPWRNPMKTGIVKNTYDSTEAINYYYGIGFVAAFADYPASSVNWGNDDQAIGNTDGAFWGVFNRWDVTPGVKKISAIRQFMLYATPTQATAVYLEVWREDDTEYTLIGTSEAMTPPAHAYNTTLTPTTPVEVTIEADKVYYVGLRIVRNTAQAAGPYCYTTTDLTFGYNHFRYAMKAGSWNGATISKTDSAGNLYTYQAASGLLMRITYTSDSYIEQDRATPEAGTYWLARGVTQPHIVKLEGVVVADGEALTAITQDVTGAGVTAQRYSTELDCGDTTGGQNDIIYAAATVNLPDITWNKVPTGQEGKLFDLFWGFRLASTGREDLYWQCRELEETVHAHAVAAASTRGTLKSSATVMPAFVTLSGTYTCAKLRVGVRPIVMMGDSQTISNYGTGIRVLNTDAWGGMATSLTKPRIWIVAGRAGQTLGSYEQNVFRNDTAGTADLVELAGAYPLRCLWALCGLGVNDIQISGTPTDASIAEKTHTLLAQYASILKYLGDEDLAIAGLPPCSAATIVVQEAKALRYLNRGLLGLALAHQCVFYNPWLDTVTPGTKDDDVPTLLAAYNTSEDGTHLSADGGTAVRAQFKRAIENSTVDLRDAWS